MILKNRFAYQIPNDMTHSSIEHYLIQDEMDEIQLQSSEDRITSGQVSGCLNKVQLATGQISTWSNQKTVAENFNGQSTSNSRLVGYIQQNRLSRGITNSAISEKKEPQLSNPITKVFCF